MTTAFKEDDIRRLKAAFVSSIDELISANILKSHAVQPVQQNHVPSAKTLNQPPLPGARLGMDESGNPAWYVQDEKLAGAFKKIEI